MNSELKDRVFKIPQNIIDFLKQQKDVEGITRNKHLIETGSVTYGQLKRILHDMKKINKNTDIVRYNLYGGDLMRNWGITTLTNERNLIKNRESATRIANDIAGLTGERTPPSLKKRKSSFSIGTKMTPPSNLIKSNSSKFSFASLFSPKAMKLFEDEEIVYDDTYLQKEIKKIKKLML